MHKLKTTVQKFIKQPVTMVIALTLLVSGLGVAIASPSASAACSVTTAPYGSVSYTASVPQDGTYRVAVRMKAGSATDNTVAVDIGNSCNMTIGGSSVSTTSGWTWAYSSSNISLTAGNNAVVLRGVAPSVQIDRVLVMTNTACVPTGTGDNCHTPPDTTPPTVVITLPTDDSDLKGTVTVSANAEDIGGSVTKVEFYYAGSVLIGSDDSSPYSVSWDTLSVTKPVPNGQYSLTAKAFDTSNLTTTSKPVPVKVANIEPPKPPDTIPPSVPLNLKVVMAIGTKDSQANLTWDPSTDDSGVVTGYDVYKATIPPCKEVCPSPIPAFVLLKTVPSNSTTDAGLTMGHTYSYYVVAIDGAVPTKNKSGNSATVSVTVPDTILPTVSVTSPLDGATVSGPVSVTATASDNVGGVITKVQFLVDGVLQTPADTSAPYAFSWDTTKTVPNGSHTISAESFDAAGNRSLRDSKTVNVQNGDITPPTVPGKFIAVATAYNKIDLSWTASTDASGIKDYLLVRNGVWQQLMGPGATSFSDTSVLPSTTYNYEIIAIDNADNISSAKAPPVTTPAEPDKTPPSVPGGLTATAVSTSQIDLAWTASTDNIGVAGYQIFRGTTQIATVTTLTFGDTSLTADTSYSYTVKAIDAAGNTSPASIEASARTQLNPGSAPNIAVGKPAIASSIESATYPASNATDNSTTTRWASALPGSDPQWIYVDLGSIHAVSAVRLNWESAYATAYQIQVSNDATNWTNIFTTTTGNGGVDDLTGLSGSGRYVRMNGTVRGTQWGYSLYDFAVYGTPPTITTGAITGVVRNSLDGKAIGRVNVSVTYNGSLHRVRTASGGQYTFTGIPQGTYDFKFTRLNYDTQIVPNTIVGGTTITADIKMVRK